MRRWSVRAWLPDPVKQWLDEEATRRGETLSATVRRLLTDLYIAAKGGR